MNNRIIRSFHRHREKKVEKEMPPSLQSTAEIEEHFATHSDSPDGLLEDPPPDVVALANAFRADIDAMVPEITTGLESMFFRDH